MRIRRRFIARRVTASNALLLVGCMSITMLFAQAPFVPGPAGNSAATLPDARTIFTYKVIDAPEHTYGYDVFAEGRVMIHQTSAPALPGNEGFKTKEGATKVALFVIEKIKQGEMPPTISIDEMRTLEVIK